MVNEYEARARAHKVSALVVAFRQAREWLPSQVKPLEIETWTEDSWRLLERLAGVRPASAKTREAVVQYLRAHPDCPADPWEGI